MIENSDDLIQFSSPQPSTGGISVLAQKTPKCLLDSSLTSGNNTLTESLHRSDDMNESKLDRVDFIEVAELDQDDMWLCEPRAVTDNKENVKNLVKKSKNAYKWMMEDFDQDKNLDKVKRTLLIALDDISKGFNRRSRSVSTTRNGYGYYNREPSAAPPPTPSCRFIEPNTLSQMVQSKSIESILNESTADLNRTYSKESGLDLVKKNLPTETPVSNRPSIKQIFNSVKRSFDSLSDNEDNIEYLDENVFYESAQTCCILESDEDKDIDDVAIHIAEIESYLRSMNTSEVCADCRTNSSSSSIKKPSRQHSIKSLEWDTEDVIDSNYYQNGNVINSKYATIVKAKRQSIDENPVDISVNSPCNLTYSNDSNDMTGNKTETYEDFTDLQVVAKMQEENLRQSVLNLSKITVQNLNRSGFSTATITKRTHPMRPSFPLQLPNENANEDSFRRYSASSSEHSSISSTNLESPYNSQVNVNLNEFFWDDEVVDPDSGKIVVLDNKNSTSSSTSLQLCSLCSRPLDQGPNGVQSPIKKTNPMPKSSTITHGISTVSSKPKGVVNRSSTPSVRAISRESRLPTPRSGRSSGALNTSLTVNIKSTQSKSPSNFTPRNLQLSKPPPAPLSNQTNQTPANKARRPIAYGTQRSATTSIVQSQSQIKAAVFQKNQVARSAQKIKPPSSKMNVNATPSSMSASSSAHQIPSSTTSRNSPNSQPIHQLSSSAKANVSNGRNERSTSPVHKLGSSQTNLSHGSNSNLQTIAESRIPAHLNSPAMGKKITSQIKARKSFLPQPVQSTVNNRQSSISPSRTRNVSPVDWKDGCY